MITRKGPASESSSQPTATKPSERREMSRRAYCMAELHGWSVREIGRAMGITDRDALQFVLEGNAQRYEQRIQQVLQAERSRAAANAYPWKVKVS